MNSSELFDNIVKKASFLCVGLDTEIEKIPSFLLREKDPVFEFNKRIIDATQLMQWLTSRMLHSMSVMVQKDGVSLEATVRYIKDKLS